MAVPGLQSGLLAVRVGLIWLMLIVVLGLRATRALLQERAPANTDRPRPAAPDGVSDGGRAPPRRKRRDRTRPDG